MDEIYNVAHNPLGMLHNVPLAYDPGKELHPPILSMLAMHGSQVNRKREIYAIDGTGTMKVAGIINFLLMILRG